MATLFSNANGRMRRTCDPRLGIARVSRGGFLAQAATRSQRN